MQRFGIGILLLLHLFGGGGGQASVGQGTVDLTGNDNILCADLTTLDDTLRAANSGVMFTQPGSCIPWKLCYGGCG